MANKTLTDVREALADLMENIKLANGYSVDLPNSHIYSVLDQENINNTKDSAYPKMFITLVEAESELGISESATRRAAFAVIVLVKKVNSSDNPQEMIEALITDIENLLAKNEGLNGTVQSAQVVHAITDGGASYPEGRAILRIETERETFCT